MPLSLMLCQASELAIMNAGRGERVTTLSRTPIGGWLIDGVLSVTSGCFI
jgi:hypothetical protein